MEPVQLEEMKGNMLVGRTMGGKLSLVQKDAIFILTLETNLPSAFTKKKPATNSKTGQLLT